MGKNFKPIRQPFLTYFSEENELTEKVFAEDNDVIYNY